MLPSPISPTRHCRFQCSGCRNVTRQCLRRLQSKQTFVSAGSAPARRLYSASWIGPPMSNKSVQTQFSLPAFRNRRTHRRPFRTWCRYGLQILDRAARYRIHCRRSQRASTGRRPKLAAAMPPPEEGWHYLDGNGQSQGPFSLLYLRGACARRSRQLPSCGRRSAAAAGSCLRKGIAARPKHTFDAPPKP